MHILVTAGPTREFLDPVRYLTNRSTGTLGYRIASRAASRGHRVTLISGPVTLCPPPATRVVQVVSAADLAREVFAALPEADAVVMTAAVADYTAAPADHKLKKTGGPLTVAFTPTIDILAEIGRRKRPDQIVVGFSLETEAALPEAERKLKAKNCDMIVVNGPRNFGEVTVDVTVLSADGQRLDWVGLSKGELADRLLNLVERGRAR